MAALLAAVTMTAAKNISAAVHSLACNLSASCWNASGAGLLCSQTQKLGNCVPDEQKCRGHVIAKCSQQTFLTVEAFWAGIMLTESNAWEAARE